MDSAPCPGPLASSADRLSFGLALGLASLLLAAGCAPAELDASATSDEAPTEALCPDDSGLTYETFGRAFMASYCTRCHDSSLSGSERRGAPSDHNFDTLELIHATSLAHIDAEAAAGPNAFNTAMPPQGAAPSDEDRYRLGEWLACGAP